MYWNYDDDHNNLQNWKDSELQSNLSAAQAAVTGQKVNAAVWKCTKEEQSWWSLRLNYSGGPRRFTPIISHSAADAEYSLSILCGGISDWRRLATIYGGHHDFVVSLGFPI